MGLGKHSTAAEVIVGHDLRGREAIVTGGNSGIGVETARALAAAGARVLITGRDLAKGQAAVTALRADTGNPDIEFTCLDHGRLPDVARFVDTYLATNRELHLLINNAAVLSSERSYTEHGFELQLGVNHLGHFALTTGLLPALRAAGSARVIVLSSRAHRHSDFDFEDPNFRRREYDTWQAYGHSKTACTLFAVDFNRRHVAAGVTANAVMPGLAMTDLPRYMSRADLTALGWVDAAGNPITPAGWKTIEQGAATTVWAAVAPELEGVGGRYLEDCAIAKPWPDPATLPGGHYAEYALDADRAARLWSLSEAFLRHAGRADLEVSAERR